KPKGEVEMTQEELKNRDYQAIVVNRFDGVFDSIQIDADNDVDAKAIAFKWASGRGHWYTMSLTDVGGDEPRHIAFMLYHRAR
ncbi:MAG: hypothetical protein RR340_10195, partial [Cloacibacillus sp.]